MLFNMCWDKRTHLSLPLCMKGASSASDHMPLGGSVKMSLCKPQTVLFYAVLSPPGLLQPSGLQLEGKAVAT